MVVRLLGKTSHLTRNSRLQQLRSPIEVVAGEVRIGRELNAWQQVLKDWFYTCYITGTFILFGSQLGLWMVLQCCCTETKGFEEPCFDPSYNFNEPESSNDDESESVQSGSNYNLDSRPDNEGNSDSGVGDEIDNKERRNRDNNHYNGTFSFDEDDNSEVWEQCEPLENEEGVDPTTSDGVGHSQFGGSASSQFEQNMIRDGGIHLHVSESGQPLNLHMPRQGKRAKGEKIGNSFSHLNAVGQECPTSFGPEKKAFQEPPSTDQFAKDAVSPCSTIDPTLSSLHPPGEAKANAPNFTVLLSTFEKAGDPFRERCMLMKLVGSGGILEDQIEPPLSEVSFANTSLPRSSNCSRVSLVNYSLGRSVGAKDPCSIKTRSFPAAAMDSGYKKQFAETCRSEKSSAHTTRHEEEFFSSNDGRDSPNQSTDFFKGNKWTAAAVATSFSWDASLQDTISALADCGDIH